MKPVERFGAGAALAAAAFLCACVTPQEMKVVQHWNTSASELHAAVPVANGLLVVRRQNVRYVHELYSRDGLMMRQTYSDRPLVDIMPVDDEVYLIESLSEARNVVRRVRADGSSEHVTPEANWTRLALAPNGHMLSFQSIYSTIDVAPSGVRIRNVTRGRDIFEDQFSYHHPLQADKLFMLSPIDRKLRAFDNGELTEIGMLSDQGHLPSVRHDGDYVAWFGSCAKGSGLISVDTNARISVLVADLSPKVFTWLGRDLLYAEQNVLTKEWSMKRIAVPSGDVIASIPVPLNIAPDQLLGSPQGDFIGLPKGQGSMLLRLSDGFNQAIPEIPLSAWRFSSDGSLLYLVTDGGLSIVKLR